MSACAAPYLPVSPACTPPHAVARALALLRHRRANAGGRTTSPRDRPLQLVLQRPHSWVLVDSMPSESGRLSQYDGSACTQSKYDPLTPLALTPRSVIIDRSADRSGAKHLFSLTWRALPVREA